MVASYRKINYNLRPAKHAERLMICEALRRLAFAPIHTYQYVGMGSVYFADFALFHRALGMNTMFSIEQRTADQARFEFNLPFSNIQMKWGSTSSQLPTIDLALRTAAWLDYDGKLTKAILSDIRHFVSEAAPGSFLAVTVQCEPEPPNPADPTELVNGLIVELGRQRIPAETRDDDLAGWGLAGLCRRIIFEEIEDALASINGVRPIGQRKRYAQVLNFEYADGAKMMTTGGVIYDEGLAGQLALCAFENLAFYRTGPEAFRIDLPRLTPRELRFIEAQMPEIEGRPINLGAIPVTDAKHYVKIYRYFPNFSAVDL